VTPAALVACTNTVTPLNVYVALSLVANVDTLILPVSHAALTPSRSAAGSTASLAVSFAMVFMPKASLMICLLAISPFVVQVIAADWDSLATI